MINCKQIAQEIKDGCKQRLAKIENRDYYLKIIQVEGDIASNAYTKGKKKDCEEIGLKCEHVLLPSNSDYYDVCAAIDDGNYDDNCAGIILQLPLPEHLKKFETKLTLEINIDKDVDGFIEKSQTCIGSDFQPCTPKAIMHIIHKEYGSIDGKVVTVVGRGKLVGRPLIKMLDEENATVICCNSHTDKRNLRALCNISNIIVTATGHKDTLTADTFLSSLHMTRGKFIVDAGITRDKNGKLCGDCNKELYGYIDKITPVPNGVGLVTRAMLMQNCVEAIERIENGK